MLDGGELAEALEDFTGGVAEPIDFAAIKVAEDEEAMKEFFDILKKEAGYKSLMAASIPVSRIRGRIFSLRFWRKHS